jgi:hypothetical protein
MRACRFKVNQLVFAILLLLQLWCVGIQAQHSEESSNKRIIEEPERLSGVWETDIGSGKTIGLHFNLTTAIEGSPTSLTRILQYEEHLDIGVYQKNGKDLTFGDQNYFSLSGDGAASWDGKRLILKFAPPPTAKLPAIDLNLIYDEKQQAWTGLFHRDSFSGDVTLRRPNADRSDAGGSPFVGTWSDKGGIMNNCIHISQDKNGALTAWSDDIQTPGQMRYANGIQPPTQTMEHYGEIAKVSMDAPDRLTVELRAYTAMCCSHPFTAKLSADGQSLAGNWLAGPNQAPRPVIWVRMPSNSCISPPSSETH